MIKAIKNSKNGKSVGIFGKEKYTGSFMDAWRAEFDKESFETVNIFLVKYVKIFHNTIIS